MERIYTPVLLIGFNRVDYIKQSFAAIRSVRPIKLYVAIDGPRPSKELESEKVNEVIEVVKNVDWPCDVHYRFSSENMGCKDNITSSISWVFQNEDRLIVVEDDIVAPYSFFLFEQKMLEKYKDDKRIAAVTGNNYTPFSSSDVDYHFSLVAGHIWGWGTWKRAWERFDVNMPDLGLSLIKGLPSLRDNCIDSREFIHYYIHSLMLFYSIKAKKNNYWGPQFGMYRRLNNLLNIVPAVNLASNIGTCSARTGTTSMIADNYWESHPSFYVIHEPTIVCRDVEYDKMHLKNHLYSRSLKGKVHSLCRLLYYVLLSLKHKVK